MTPEYYLYIITALAVVIIVLLLINYKQKKKAADELAAQKKESAEVLNLQKTDYEQRLKNELTVQYRKYEEQLRSVTNEHELKLAAQIKAKEDYKKQIVENLKKNIPYGERLLLKKFRDLLQDPAFADFTIYRGLEFSVNGIFRQVDFFVVSPKGLLVIESKRWAGTTYIYTGDARTVFTDTEHDSFGKAGYDNVKVFNAVKSKDREGQIVFSSYSNPIAQAREYSLILKDKLNAKSVDNLVIFSPVYGGKVVFNDHPLSACEVGPYTRLILDEGDNLKQFLLNWGSSEKPDVQRIKSLINSPESSLTCDLIIDGDRCGQAPMNHIDECF